MRPDMAKVIVERPRLGGGARRPKGLRKRERLAMNDLAPGREGYRRRWTSGTKHLNEHLAPLRRYLQSQVGRPWNKVHSEISRHLRLDSAVQSHVLDHLWDYVETSTRLVDGVVCNAAGEPIGGHRCLWRRPLFYVCPKSGLLKLVRRESHKQRPVAEPAERIVLGDWRQWHCVEGIWYEIKLAPLCDAPPHAWDMLLRACVRDLPRQTLVQTYGGHWYALGKRQLGKREVRIAQRRLANLANRRSM
jgi:hypothetical protein